MEIPNNVRKLIYGMFDAMIEGVDKYATNSSTWLIFTEEKRWVIEFTNEKTLWFNYNLFQSELNLLSMDCVESKDIIKEWFESRFLGIDAVEETLSTAGKPLKVEDTIQNGVKDTHFNFQSGLIQVEDVIQNGVKEVEKGSWFNVLYTEDVIQNGVKETYECFNSTNLIDDIIQNGVKTTLPEDDIDIGFVKNAIQNGVKEINHVDVMKFFDNKMEAALQNGIKETKSMCGKRDGRVNNTIQNGVKDTLDIYSRCEWEVKYAIKNGVRHVEDGDWLDQDDRIEEIIKNGVKS
jgi:hypothetical protein